MLLTNTYSQKDFLANAQELLLKNQKNNAIFYDYYQWHQWYVPGISTRAGIPAIDKRKKDKNYSWVVVNLIKDCVDTIKNLSSWVSWIENNVSSELNINFENLHDNIIENILLYWNSYIKIYKDFDWNISLNILDNLLTIHNTEILKNENWDEYKYEEYVLYKIKNENQYWQKEYEYTIYTIDYIREYNENWILIYEKPNELWFIPIFKINWNESYVKDLIQTQDMLNISLTQEFEINKYSWDPLTVALWIGMVDIQWKAITNDSVKTGSWELLMLWADWDVKRIDSKWVSDQFLSSLDRYKKDLYRMWKIGSLKNDDLNWVTSWYALQLKLLDTISFVQKLRWCIKIWFNNMFSILKSNTWLDLNFEYSSIIPISNLDVIDECKWYQELWFSFDFIAKKMWLTEEEIMNEKLNIEKEKIVIENNIEDNNENKIWFNAT